MWCDMHLNLFRHQRWSAHDPACWRPFLSTGCGKCNHEKEASLTCDCFDRFSVSNFFKIFDHGPLRGRFGIGFDLLESQEIVVVDLDDCRNRHTGEIAAWALRIIRALDSYTEISPSGTGVKIYLNGTKPGGRCKGTLPTGQAVEIYSNRRFVAVTGQHLSGTPADLMPGQAVLTLLYCELFPGEVERVVNGQRPVEATAEDGDNEYKGGNAARPITPHDLSDDELLDRARSARNGDTFRALFDFGDLTAFGGDHSRADMALCSRLAWWTGGDAAAIDRLFRRSKLYREKWDRTDYREGTISRAIAGCRSFYDPNRNQNQAGQTSTRADADAADPHETLDFDTDTDEEQKSAPLTAAEDRMMETAWQASQDWDATKELAEAIMAAVVPPPKPTLYSPEAESKGSSADDTGAKVKVPSRTNPDRFKFVLDLTNVTPEDLEGDRIVEGERARWCGDVYEFHHLRDRRVANFSLKCKQWRCGVCIHCLRSVWRKHLEPILRRCERVYVWFGSAKAWPAIRKSITKNGKAAGLWVPHGTRERVSKKTGEVKVVELGSVGYVRYWHGGDEMCVIAEVPFDVPKKHGGSGVICLSGGEGAALISQIIEEIPQCLKRPLSTSHKWRLPEREVKPRQWTRVRRLGNQGLLEHQRIYSSFGVGTELWEWSDKCPQPWSINWVVEVDVEALDALSQVDRDCLYCQLRGSGPPLSQTG
jgi:hypothetical protein